MDTQFVRLFCVPKGFLHAIYQALHERHQTSATSIVTKATAREMKFCVVLYLFFVKQCHTRSDTAVSTD